MMRHQHAAVTLVVAGLISGLGTVPSASKTGSEGLAAGRGSEPLNRVDPAVQFVPCGDTQPQDAICGRVRVPVDRREPGLGTLDIAFDLRPHLDESQPAAGTLVVPNPLGDGLSASFAQAEIFRADHYGAAQERWDVLFVDDRGTGRSTGARCPALQHFDGSRPELTKAVGACGDRLGPLANRLGTAYVADDLEAVRLALGLGQIDLAGVEAAVITMDAYATRYPDSVRSLTIESPSVPAFDTDPWMRLQPGRLSASAVATCESGPMCRSAGQDVAGAIAELARRLAARPITATGYDDAGSPHRVRITEQSLIRILQDTSGSYVNQGEVGAAAAAWNLRHDPVPLARLAAVSTVGVSVNPTFDLEPDEVNVAVTFARACSDYALPFDRSASTEVRREQYERAVRRLPADVFAPFTRDTWLRVMTRAQYCLDWPAAAGRRAPIAPGADFPDVPVLVVVSSGGTLSGPDLGRLVADQYPDSGLVVQPMGDGGPINQCGDLMRDWLMGLDQTAVSCPDQGARESMGVYPRFVAQQLPVAEPMQASGDESTRWDRKLAAMSVAVARDWLIHSERPGTASGRGLRGGTWEITGGTDDSADVTFEAVRWTRDVTMSGEFHLLPFDGLHLRWTADLDITGAGGLTASLHIDANHAFEHDAMATVVGVVDGRVVAVRAPAL